jgi:hypothetical protein
LAVQRAVWRLCARSCSIDWIHSQQFLKRRMNQWQSIPVLHISYVALGGRVGRSIVCFVRWLRPSLHNRSVCHQPAWCCRLDNYVGQWSQIFSCIH